MPAAPKSSRGDVQKNEALKPKGAIATSTQHNTAMMTMTMSTVRESTLLSESSRHRCILDCVHGLTTYRPTWPQRSWFAQLALSVLHIASPSGKHWRSSDASSNKAEAG